MKKFFNPVYLSMIVLITLAFLFSISGNAQNVVRKGNVFIEQKSDSSQRGNAKKTNMLFTDAKGQMDTIYVSSRGSAFVWKVSKKTGKRYRKYLPKITEELKTKKL